MELECDTTINRVCQIGVLAQRFVLCRLKYHGVFIMGQFSSSRNRVGNENEILLYSFPRESNQILFRYEGMVCAAMSLGRMM